MGTLAGFAASLGLPTWLVADVLHERHEHVSLRAENRVRRALGLEPVGAYEVPPCRTCGGLHVAEDCQGKGEGQVVVLAEGESVRPARRAAQPWVKEAARVLQELLEKRQAQEGPRCYNRQGWPVIGWTEVR